jgi:hypothetical protein
MGKPRKSAIADAVAIGASTQITYTSLSDMSYDQALSIERGKEQAKYALDHIVGFPDECSDMARDELNDGWVRRWKVNNPEVMYAKVDGNYILVTEADADRFEKVEKCLMSADIALSFTTHEFGRLNETHDPTFKSLVARVRKQVGDYCSGNYKRLVATAKEVLKERNGEAARTRSATKTIDTRIVEWFAATEKSVGVAVKRGDPTANADRFSKAKIQFFAVWNHQD